MLIIRHDANPFLIIITTIIMMIMTMISNELNRYVPFPEHSLTNTRSTPEKRRNRRWEAVISVLLLRL